MGKIIHKLIMPRPGLYQRRFCFCDIHIHERFDSLSLDQFSAPIANAIHRCCHSMLGILYIGEDTFLTIGKPKHDNGGYHDSSEGLFASDITTLRLHPLILGLIGLGKHVTQSLS